MPVFAYIARSRSGEKIEGSVEAGDRHAAILQIERLGHVPVSVREDSTARKTKAAPVAAGGKATKWRLTLWPGRGPRMGTRETLQFTTELGDLLASGMKLGNALNTLSRRRTRPDADAIIASLRDDIIRGTSLSEALARFKETFPPLFVSMIRAGEASGALPEVMQRLVKNMERMQETKEKVIMALVYPGIVLIAGTGTLVFAMSFVIPRFAVIFKELNSTLPLPTKILIGISTVMVNYGVFIVAGLLIAILLIRRWLKTDIGISWWHSFQLHIPLIRSIVFASNFAQFARTLGMLIGNGVSVLEALGIVERAIQNRVLSAEIRNARSRVTDGATISVPLAAGRIFPPILTDMLAIGEETGDMSGALGHIAQRYENELDRSVKIFTTVLEPILIVLMAVLVGFVAISILLAVFEMTSGLNA